jgi:hypothetical protein
LGYVASCEEFIRSQFFAPDHDRRHRSIWAYKFGSRRDFPVRFDGL